MPRDEWAREPAMQYRKLGTEQPFLTADQRAELEAREAAAKDWSRPPTICPYCAGRKLVLIGEWTARSAENNNPNNTDPITEYQCHGFCQGRSFWV